MAVTLGELVKHNTLNGKKPIFSKENIMAGIALNNKMDPNEAAKVLECSYSYVIHLITKKKLKAQKKSDGKGWLIDADDVYKAKASGLTKQRNRAKKGGKAEPAAISNPAIGYRTVDAVPEHLTRMVLDIDKSKYEILNLIMKSKNKTLKEYLNDQIEGLYKKATDALNQTDIQL